MRLEAFEVQVAESKLLNSSSVERVKEVILQ
jgi:hypothetical protein